MLICPSLGGLKENSLGAAGAAVSLAAKALGWLDEFGSVSRLDRYSKAVEWSPIAVGPNFTNEWESSSGGRTPTARHGRWKSLSTNTSSGGPRQQNKTNHNDHGYRKTSSHANLSVPDLQQSWNLYSLALLALKIRSIFTVSRGSSVPKPSLGCTSIYCRRWEMAKNKVWKFTVILQHPPFKQPILEYEELIPIMIAAGLFFLLFFCLFLWSKVCWNDSPPPCNTREALHCIVLLYICCLQLHNFRGSMKDWWS